MFTDKYQGKLISVYHSIGSHPLADWLVQCKEGDLRTVKDEALKSNVLQIQSTNVVACSITTPADPRGSLNVRLPFLTLQLKNLCRYFTFEVTVLDADNIRRRFRAGNFLSAERTSMFAKSMPLRLADGWNLVRFNLSEFTERTFGTSYAETVRVSVHANCRLRRVYFSDRLYADDQLPEAFRMFPTARPRDKPARFAVTVPAKKASAKTTPAKKASAKTAPAKEAVEEPAEEAAGVTAAPAVEAIEVTAAPAVEAAEVTAATAVEAAEVTAATAVEAAEVTAVAGVEETAAGVTAVASAAASDGRDDD